MKNKMECKIQDAGLWDGKQQYYCITHRSVATNEKGEKLQQCISTIKSDFENGLTIKKEEIKKCILKYPNLLVSPKGELYINDKITSGILYIEDSVFEIRDFGGMLLSNLNNIQLKVEYCPFCGHIHSDDGRFAYERHNPHLCAYCGHFFEVKEANVGNELAVLFEIPKIKLDSGKLKIDNKVELIYDLLKGEVLVNGKKVNVLQIEDMEYDLVSYLNHVLYHEF